MANKEKWKEIENYEGIYQISSIGRIKSLPRIISRNGKKDFLSKEKIIKPFLSKTGYLCVKLRKKAIDEHFRIHRIVALTFLTNTDSSKDVNHINGIRIDNRVENLEFVNRRENCCHGKRTKNKSSEFVGVSFCKQTGKWKSAIMIDKKIKTIGRFNSEKDAYNSRINYEKVNCITNKYL